MKTVIKQLIIGMLACLCVMPVMAIPPADSVARDMSFTRHPAFRITMAGVPAIVEGLAIKGANGNLKGATSNNARRYGNTYEDYVMFTPGVALLAMKIGGVEGRSSWSRMMVSDAFSAAITIGATKGLKYMVNEMRPNGEDDKSFPSMHTALAYMMATMLHKEYGHCSPWISLGGYMAATATAAGRVAHNCHWASDVMVGAGIGIVATEVGYYFADLIFRGRGLSDIIVADEHDRWSSPSFLSADLAMNLPLTRYIINGATVKPAVGINSGVQGARFFNPYVGLGGSAAVSVMPIEHGSVLAQKTMKSVRTLAGAYFAYPLLSSLKVGAKVTGGYVYYGKCELPDATTIGGKSAATFEAGVSLSVLANESFGFRLFCDYGVSGSYIKEQTAAAQYVSVGGSASIYF